ncbi:hypothetical protein M514_01575 [Trichuris suis]|uniref:Serine aminopeptidase S33 domain-containing protein n=1 Tax=Trichuris suis TaxID=68888 RepID=A0A085NAT3_9BILA|nr:hypothetical protein M514_01575 [Trichuris suis]
MGFLFDLIKSLLWFFAIVYVAIPLLFYFLPAVSHTLIFMTAVKWPFANYSDPRTHGVKYESRNFYLNVEPGIVLGCWQILPKALYRRDQSSSRSEREFDELLAQQGYPIVMYMHGNTWTRSAAHRVLLYNMLSELNLHVIAFDYRGFGDSTGMASEEGINRDVQAMYRWISERSGENPILLWGHSLGTAIATRLGQEVCHSDVRRPAGLVLEAPFNNLAEVVRHHPFTYMFRWLPWFEQTIVQPCAKNDLNFNTDLRIRHLCFPLLFLHAKDDRIIPFHLAKKLEQEAKDAGVDTTFIEFDHPHNYGHKYIINAPELPDVVYEFVQHCISQDHVISSNAK